jgi:plasmid stabilization system protein ParE
VVIWTPRARADLKAIHDYIARDSRQNAQRVIREILRKADTLADPPQAGRKVPEINEPSLREISAYTWRIIYHLRDGDVFVVTLVHKRRQPGLEDFTVDNDSQEKT